MNVKESQISMRSSHTYSETEKVVSTKEVNSFQGYLLNTAGLLAPKQASVESMDQFQLSDKINRQLFRILFETITGKSVEESTEMGDIDAQVGFANDASRVQRSAATNFLQQVRVQEVSVYQRAYRFESESLVFEIKGEVALADGRSQLVELRLNMSRAEEYEKVSMATQKIVLKDPLIISFMDEVALSDERFSFDIDCDGVSETISKLGDHCGFLALDKNSDGIVNDGSELFGALSGSGFDDLKQYDVDGNGFIDSSDEVFDQLLVWRKDASSDRLETLKSTGVGALALQSLDTSFRIKNQQGDLLAQLKSSGFYLTEQGDVGLLQQVDMAV